MILEHRQGQRTIFRKEFKESAELNVAITETTAEGQRQCREKF